jgi:hypothetical protein
VDFHGEFIVDILCLYHPLIIKGIFQVKLGGKNKGLLKDQYFFPLFLRSTNGRRTGPGFIVVTAGIYLSGLAQFRRKNYLLRRYKRPFMGPALQDLLNQFLHNNPLCIDFTTFLLHKPR